MNCFFFNRSRFYQKIGKKNPTTEIGIGIVVLDEEVVVVAAGMISTARQDTIGTTAPTLNLGTVAVVAENTTTTAHHAAGATAGAAAAAVTVTVTAAETITAAAGAGAQAGDKGFLEIWRFGDLVKWKDSI